MRHFSMDYEAVDIVSRLILELVFINLGLALCDDLSGVNAGYLGERLCKLIPIWQQQHHALIAADALNKDSALQEFVQRLQTGQLQFFEATLPSRPSFLYSPSGARGCPALLALEPSSSSVSHRLPAASLLDRDCVPPKSHAHRGPAIFHVDPLEPWLNQRLSRCIASFVAVCQSAPEPRMLKPSNHASGTHSNTDRVSKQPNKPKKVVATLPAFVVELPGHQGEENKVDVKKRRKTGGIQKNFACPFEKFHPGRYPECTAARSKWMEVRSLFRRDNEHLNWHLRQGHMTADLRQELDAYSRGQGDHQQQVRIWQRCFCSLYPEFTPVQGSLNPYHFEKLLPDEDAPEERSRRLRRHSVTNHTTEQHTGQAGLRAHQNIGGATATNLPDDIELSANPGSSGRNHARRHGILPSLHPIREDLYHQPEIHHDLSGDLGSGWYSTGQWRFGRPGPASVPISHPQVMADVRLHHQSSRSLTNEHVHTDYMDAVEFRQTHRNPTSLFPPTVDAFRRGDVDANAHVSNTRLELPGPSHTAAQYLQSRYSTAGQPPQHSAPSTYTSSQEPPDQASVPSLSTGTTRASVVQNDVSFTLQPGPYSQLDEDYTEIGNWADWRILQVGEGPGPNEVAPPPPITNVAQTDQVEEEDIDMYGGDLKLEDDNPEFNIWYGPDATLATAINDAIETVAIDGQALPHDNRHHRHHDQEDYDDVDEHDDDEENGEQNHVHDDA